MNDERRRRGPPPTPGKEGWHRTTMRTPPELRGQLAAIAAVAGVTLDGVVQLALRDAASQRCCSLPGWVPPAPAQTRAPASTSQTPKVWFRYPSRWVPIIMAWRTGEATTMHGAIRDAVRAFFAQGPQAWAAARTDVGA